MCNWGGNENDIDGEQVDEQPPGAEPSGENPAGPRLTGAPSATPQQRSSRPYQVRQRDIVHPISPPRDADER